jgi:hypothetical protein
VPEAAENEAKKRGGTYRAGQGMPSNLFQIRPESLLTYLTAQSSTVCMELARPLMRCGKKLSQEDQNKVVSAAIIRKRHKKLTLR